MCGRCLVGDGARLEKIDILDLALGKKDESLCQGWAKCSEIINALYLKGRAEGGVHFSLYQGVRDLCCFKARQQNADRTESSLTSLSLLRPLQWVDL